MPLVSHTADCQLRSLVEYLICLLICPLSEQTSQIVILMLSGLE